MYNTKLLHNTFDSYKTAELPSAHSLSHYKINSTTLPLKSSDLRVTPLPTVFGMYFGQHIKVYSTVIVGIRFTLFPPQ
jgi:hypothetical protein